MTIILASGSPRRRELLTQAQIDFEVMGVDIDESLLAHETPTDYIKRMVKAKSVAAITQFNTPSSTKAILKTKATFPTSVIILTADTIGVLSDNKTVLVKPVDYQQAYAMWQKMSDTMHQVWTAVRAVKLQLLLTDDGHKEWQIIDERQIIESTEVSFIPLGTSIMQDYWNSGEPVDKAGGYGIQGLAAAWVTRINGSYTNVVGLPLAQTLSIIKSLED